MTKTKICYSFGRRIKEKRMQWDADVQIVSKALELTEEKNIVLVGENTDLCFCFIIVNLRKKSILHQNPKKVQRV